LDLSDSIREENKITKLSGLFQKYANELFAHQTQRSQRKWFFVLAVRGRQNKSLHLFEAKRFVQVSAGSREAAFYSAASHGRIKENINPLRSRRLCGEISILDKNEILYNNVQSDFFSKNTMKFDPF